MTQKRVVFSATVQGVLLVDQEHLAEIQSPEWAEDMYPFANETEALEYLARLMVLFGGPINKFDGHAHVEPQTASVALDEYNFSIISVEG